MGSSTRDLKVADARWELSCLALDATPSSAEETLNAMLLTLCEHLVADTFSTIVAAWLPQRKRRRGGLEPIGAWHPVVVVPDPRRSSRDAATRLAWISAGRHTEEPATRMLVARAGEVRAVRNQAFYAQAEGDNPMPALFKRLGVRDRLVVGAPITAKREVYFLFDRKTCEAPFEPSDEELVVASLPALVRVAGMMCRLYGWLDAVESFTPREREVLSLLLEGLSEAECALRLNLREGSTHQIVVRIFRKLQVKTRGELMALWLRPAAGGRVDATQVESMNP